MYQLASSNLHQSLNFLPGTVTRVELMNQEIVGSSAIEFNIYENSFTTTVLTGKYT
jgi:hypothetical protein